MQQLMLPVAADVPVIVTLTTLVSGLVAAKVW